MLGRGCGCPGSKAARGSGASSSSGVPRVVAAIASVPRPARLQQQRSSSSHSSSRDALKARFFKFGKNGMGSEAAGIYGSQGRDDYSADDVEHYFNYMGMLAVEGTYDRMYAMTASGLAPVDVLLIMAAQENDLPKVEELLGAGADVRVADNNGKSPLQLATKAEVIAVLEAAASKVAA